MYAAGHPPLPGIEVATFSDLIPPHWWLVSGEALEEPIRQAAGFQPRREGGGPGSRWSGRPSPSQPR